MNTENRPILAKNATSIIEVELLSHGGTEGLGLAEYISQCYELNNVFEIEALNDTHCRFDVRPLNPGDPLYQYDLQDAERAIAQGGCKIGELGLVLNKMASDGHLQSGVYLVNTSW